MKITRSFINDAAIPTNVISAFWYQFTHNDWDDTAEAYQLATDALAVGILACKITRDDFPLINNNLSNNLLIAYRLNDDTEYKLVTKISSIELQQYHFNSDTDTYLYFDLREFAINCKFHFQKAEGVVTRHYHATGSGQLIDQMALSDRLQEQAPDYSSLSSQMQSEGGLIPDEFDSISKVLTPTRDLAIGSRDLASEHYNIGDNVLWYHGASAGISHSDSVADDYQTIILQYRNGTWTSDSINSLNPTEAITWAPFYRQNRDGSDYAIKEITSSSEAIKIAYPTNFPMSPNNWFEIEGYNDEGHFHILLSGFMYDPRHFLGVNTKRANIVEGAVGTTANPKIVFRADSSLGVYILYFLGPCTLTCIKCFLGKTYYPTPTVINAGSAIGEFIGTVLYGQTISDENKYLKDAFTTQLTYPKFNLQHFDPTEYLQPADFSGLKGFCGSTDGSGIIGYFRKQLHKGDITRVFRKYIIDSVGFQTEGRITIDDEFARHPGNKIFLGNGEYTYVGEVTVPRAFDVTFNDFANGELEVFSLPGSNPIVYRVSRSGIPSDNYQLCLNQKCVTIVSESGVNTYALSLLDINFGANDYRYVRAYYAGNTGKFIKDFSERWIKISSANGKDFGTARAYISEMQVISGCIWEDSTEHTNNAFGAIVRFHIISTNLASEDLPTGWYSSIVFSQSPNTDWVGPLTVIGPVPGVNASPTTRPDLTAIADYKFVVKNASTDNYLDPRDTSTRNVSYLSRFTQYHETQVPYSRSIKQIDLYQEDPNANL